MASTTSYPLPSSAVATPARTGGFGRPLVILLPILIVIVLNVFSPQNLDGTLRLTASAICVLGWVPFMFFILRKQSGLPVMPFLTLVYSVYYGWVVFLEDQFILPAIHRVLPDDLLLQGEFLCLVGILLMVIGYYILPDRSLSGIPRIHVNTDIRASIPSTVIASVLTLFISKLDVFIAVPARFSAILSVCGQLQVFCIAVLFYSQLKGYLKPEYLGFLWGVMIPVRFLTSLTSGAVGAVIYDVVVLMGAYWVARREWPWRSAAFFALLVVPMLGVKGQYRAQVWGATQDYNTYEKTKIFVGLIGNGFADQEGFAGDAFQTAVGRIDQVTTLCAVINLTPQVIPYWGGESYATLYWLLIPRVLYPDKPVKVIGQDFGHRYGLLDKRDRSTSYNLPQLVELYANFGAWGIVFGMLLIGILYRVMYQMFCHPGAGDAGILLGVVIFSHLCNIESDFSLVFGGLALQIVALSILVKLMNTKAIHLPLDMFRFR